MDITRTLKATKTAAAGTLITVGTSATTFLSASGGRRQWTLQNLSTAPIYFKLGTNCSSGDFHHILSGSTAAYDGLGGSYSNDVYTGIVTGLCLTTGNVLSAVSL